MFSVIVPTYNRAHLLPRCIASLRQQSFDDFEVVVADDGSTDDTTKVMQDLSRQDARIRYVRQANQGAGAARNLGGSVSSARYLTFLDSDDEVDAAWLSSFACRIAESQPDIICCGIKYVDGDGNYLRERLPIQLGCGLPVLSGLYRSGTFAIRREVFAAVGGYAPHLQANQHSELRCRLELQSRRDGWKTECLPDVLVTAHEHSGAKIRKNVSGVFESARYILERHAALLHENPVTFASWAAACGGAAVKLGEYGHARKWFWHALLARPQNVRNLARFALACSPGFRRLVWRQQSTNLAEELLVRPR